MKSNKKKTLVLLGLTVGLLSSPVFAEGTENAMTKENLRAAEAYVNPEISAQRSIELSRKQHEVDVLKKQQEKAELQMSIKTLESEVNAMDVNAKIKEAEKKNQEKIDNLIAEYEGRITSLEAKLIESQKELVEKKEVDNLLKNRIFVTEVMGIGGNMRAEFYFDNNINVRSVGEEVVSGAKIIEINPNGALIAVGKQQEFIGITTMDYAHSKTFEKENIEYQKMLKEAQVGFFDGKPMQTQSQGAGMGMPSGMGAMPY